MEYLHNGFTLQIPQGCFPLSTDSMLLADFVRLPRHARVLDLGSGCGTLGTLLCARDDTCQVTGIELDQAAHRAAVENIQRNGLGSRLFSICEDLRHFSQGNFDICVSNPPYYTGGPASSTAPLARRNDCCSLEALLEAAARCLKFGGDLYLVHKPENLAKLCALAIQNGLEPKRLRLVRHQQGGTVNLILLSCRKGAKSGLTIEEAALFHQDRTPTDYYRSVYHL